jgi:protoporphyrin/coproporphyrin ferrochelatase
MSETRGASTVLDTSESGAPSTATGIGGRRNGVLLMNLGTPDATDYRSMRRYLKEFLSDRRVIEEPRLKWWLILNLIILSVRPGRRGRDYDKIWNRERDESPLKTITRAQAERLADALADDRIAVDWAMRYGNPAVASRLAWLQSRDCDRVLLVPLYPQYAAATTATACDQAFRALMALRWQPAVRVAPPYYDEPAYVEAVTDSIRDHLAKLDFEPEALIASFHGMPVKYAEQGDPYPRQCLETARLVRARLGWPEGAWHTTFQSRFGSDPWIEPYTIYTVERLARSGVKRLAVVAPGFSADCLETLEELDMENRQAFLTNGGERFAYVPCLNASPLGMSVIERVVRRELAGWI